MRKSTRVTADGTDNSHVLDGASKRNKDIMKVMK